MNELKVLSSVPTAPAVQRFFSEASDLYVDFLTEGRRALAESLLSGLLLAVGSLDRLSGLPAGLERSKELRYAAAVFHKLSLLIFVSAINADDDQGDLRTLQIYDAAADLSGSLSNAARRGL